MKRAAYAIALLGTGIAWGCCVGPARAHDIVADVTLQILAVPDAERLDLLVRAPLEAMQDQVFPTRGPGYLDLERARESGILRDAATVWIAQNLRVYEDGQERPPPSVEKVRIALPSDRSFATDASARASFDEPPLSAETQLIWKQALLDVQLSVPIRGAGTDLGLLPTHARLGLRVQTALRFRTPSGEMRAYRYTGNPGRIELDPRWHQAALRFVGSGFEHILAGWDHLLFLVCLALPLRRLRAWVAAATAFTLAHSITLMASALGWTPDALWFPPLIEAAIAASIVYMAAENIVRPRTERRWIPAFGFGLVHGFGFSFALSESLQFAGAHLLTSLAAFNVGVELGQLAALALMAPLLALAFRFVVSERTGIIALSALVAHTAVHWTQERVGALLEYPSFSQALSLSALGIAVLLVGLAATAAFGLQRVRVGRLQSE